MYGAETRSVTVMRRPVLVSGPSSRSAVRYWEDWPASRVTSPPRTPPAVTVSG